MKYLNSYLLTLPLLFLLSCGGKHGDASRTDSATTSDSVVEQRVSESKDFSTVRFSSPDDVRDFLKFSAFSSHNGGRIAFGSEGGTLDSEPFTISGITVTSPNEAEITVRLPKMNLDGTFTVAISGGKVTVQDKKSRSVYNLIED